jgi:hypothetical protein
LALSGGNNRATVLFLNASPYRAIVRPYRPQVQDHIEATTILTWGGIWGFKRLARWTNAGAGLWVVVEILGLVVLRPFLRVRLVVDPFMTLDIPDRSHHNAGMKRVFLQLR